PAGGVVSAPGTKIHPVVDAAAAMGTLALESILFVPALLSPAPWAIPHRVLDPTAAAPVAFGVHPKALGGFERFLGGVALVVDHRRAPRAVEKLGRDHPAAVGTLIACLGEILIPPLGSAAVRAMRPEPVQRIAALAAGIRAGKGRPAATSAHGGPAP